MRLPLRGGPGALLEAACWKKLLVVRTFTLPPISICKRKCTLNTFWRRSRGVKMFEMVQGDLSGPTDLAGFLTRKESGTDLPILCQEMASTAES